MTAYLIVYGKNPSDRFAAYRFDDRVTARLADGLVPSVPVDGFGNYAPERMLIPGVGGCAYVIETEADVTFSGSLLIDVFNAMTDSGVKKFESRTVGVKRLMNVLPQVAIPAPAAAQPKKDIKMSDGVNTETVPAPKRGKMSEGKPANAQIFRAGKVRANTDRHQIMVMMNGTNTADDIGKAMHFSKPNYVLSHFYCLTRDCGIGYAFDDAGRVTAIYPDGEGLDTAIAVPAEKKTKAPKQPKENSAEAA